MSNQRDDYFEDNFDKVAEAYWNDDKAGDLALIGEFVLNNPKLFTLFIEEWASLPENERLVREWFDGQEYHGSDTVDERDR